jgi:hypothetical protein
MSKNVPKFPSLFILCKKISFFWYFLILVKYSNRHLLPTESFTRTEKKINVKCYAINMTHKQNMLETKAK